MSATANRGDREAKLGSSSELTEPCVDGSRGRRWWGRGVEEADEAVGGQAAGSIGVLPAAAVGLTESRIRGHSKTEDGRGVVLR